MSMSRRNILAVVGIVLIAAVGWYWHVENRASAAAEYASLLQQGIEQFDHEDYSGTLETLQRIPQDEVQDWRIPYYMGSAQMMLKDYEQAAQTLERALALNSQQTGVLYALGVSQFKQGKLALAKAYFAAVLEINPADAHAKGLMDIMANLERQQTGQPGESDIAEEDGAATEKH